MAILAWMYASYEVMVNDSGNLSWHPGEEATEIYLIDIPKDVDAGTYEMSFKLYCLNEKSDVDLALDMDTRNEEGFYRISEIKLRK
jgi:hypothetical protein